MTPLVNVYRPVQAAIRQSVQHSPVEALSQVAHRHLLAAKPIYHMLFDSPAAPTVLQALARQYQDDLGRIVGWVTGQGIPADTLQLARQLDGMATKKLNKLIRVLQGKPPKEPRQTYPFNTNIIHTQYTDGT